MTELQNTWSWLPAIYLFLGGLSAGAFCVVAILHLVTGARFKATVKFGALISFFGLASGLLALLLEVGKPFRAVILFKSFVNFNSWMTIGAWLIFGAVVLYGLFAILGMDSVVAWLGRSRKRWTNMISPMRIVLAIIGFPLSLCVAVYTGLLLGTLPFIPFWNTWLLPALFTASALDTGIALMAGYVAIREKGAGVPRLKIVLQALVMVFVATTGSVLWLYLQTMLKNSPEASTSVRLLTGGALSPLFWIIVISLALSFLAELIQLSHAIKRAALALSLAGVAPAILAGLLLRFVVLSAGLHAPLAIPGLDQVIIGATFIP
jgi:formate-dependent nitrite reductase membrane component NrfD